MGFYQTDANPTSLCSFSTKKIEGTYSLTTPLNLDNLAKHEIFRFVSHIKGTLGDIKKGWTLESYSNEHFFQFSLCADNMANANTVGELFLHKRDKKIVITSLKINHQIYSHNGLLTANLLLKIASDLSQSTTSEGVFFDRELASIIINSSSDFTAMPPSKNESREHYLSPKHIKMLEENLPFEIFTNKQLPNSNSKN